ncbi:MAG: hypothetical protein ABSD44_15060 [Terracidiphilus sp.]
MDAYLRIFAGFALRDLFVAERIGAVSSSITAAAPVSQCAKASGLQKAQAIEKHGKPP